MSWQINYLPAFGFLLPQFKLKSSPWKPFGRCCAPAGKERPEASSTYPTTSAFPGLPSTWTLMESSHPFTGPGDVRMRNPARARPSSLAIGSDILKTGRVAAMEPYLFFPSAFFWPDPYPGRGCTSPGYHLPGYLARPRRSSLPRRERPSRICFPGPMGHRWAAG